MNIPYFKVACADFDALTKFDRKKAKRHAVFARPFHCFEVPGGETPDPLTNVTVVKAVAPGLRFRACIAVRLFGEACGRLWLPDDFMESGSFEAQPEDGITFGGWLRERARAAQQTDPQAGSHELYDRAVAAGDDATAFAALLAEGHRLGRMPWEHLPPNDKQCYQFLEEIFRKVAPASAFERAWNDYQTAAAKMRGDE